MYLMCCQNYHCWNRLERQIEVTFKAAFDPNFKRWHASGIHTIRAFSRLFAHRLIPRSAEHLLYVDTDVIVMAMANLEELWKQVERKLNALFHWGMGMCLGFVVMHVHQMEEIWTLARGSPMENISEKFKHRA